MIARLRLVLWLLALLFVTEARPVASAWMANGTPLSTAPSSQLTPQLVADGSGGAIAVWYDFRNGNSDIFAQRVTGDGAMAEGWPPDGLAVCTARGGQYSPVIVTDETGGAIVAWFDERGASADIYAQRILPSGVVDPSWPADGLLLCGASGDQIYPAIASNDAGGAYVTWRDYRGGPDTDVYLQQVLGAGSVAPGWPASGVAICLAAENQSVPVVAADGSGGALVVWSDLRSGTDSDIYAQRILADGAVAPSWPVDGTPLCDAAWNQSGPSILSLGDGSAIVAWFDYRSGASADVFATRALATGGADPGWPANGVALCEAPGEQYSPVLAPDGAGGVFVAWYDYRDGEEPDIYCGHLSGDGVVDLTWPADGLALCSAPGEQSSPSIAAHGTGGALVAWFDYRSDPTSDIYGQRIGLNGLSATEWPDDGLALCDAVGAQLSPALAADGAGGTLLAWTDFRGGTYADVYGQRVAADGGVVAVPAAVPAPFRLGPVFPNPGSRVISFTLELDHPQRVAIEVFDAAGRRVRILRPPSELEAGSHAFSWLAVAEPSGSRARGVYWIRASGPSGMDARRFVLVP